MVQSMVIWYYVSFHRQLLTLTLYKQLCRMSSSSKRYRQFPSHPRVECNMQFYSNFNINFLILIPT